MMIPLRYYHLAFRRDLQWGFLYRMLGKSGWMGALREYGTHRINTPIW